MVVPALVFAPNEEGLSFYRPFGLGSFSRFVARSDPKGIRLPLPHFIARNVQIAP